MPSTLTSPQTEVPNRESFVLSPASPSAAGVFGKKDVLQVILEARKNLSDVDTATVSDMNPTWKAGQQTQKRIFKDYILSTEPYKVKSGL